MLSVQKLQIQLLQCHVKPILPTGFEHNETPLSFVTVGNDSISNVFSVPFLIKAHVIFVISMQKHVYFTLEAYGVKECASS
jgi:hypothetical protein